MEPRLEQNTPACFWQQAGVVKQKKCQTNFNCITCRYDRALRKVCRDNEAMRADGVEPKGKRANLEFWRDKLQKQPLAKRPCIHHMKGSIDFKACSKYYNCIDCEFDQYFQDQFKVYTVVKPIEFADINGVSLPFGYYLHPGHIWVKIEDKNTVRIGIDDFASRLLGVFETVETPLMGKEIFHGKPAIEVQRNGHKASFTAPVGGVITQVNTQLKKNPGLVNEDPYADGWILSLYCPNIKNDLKRLKFMNSAKKFMSREVDHLYKFLEEETGLAAADGGQLGNDLYGNIPGVSWQRILDEFILKGL
ncbi:MAG: glycine cleavage system protein H [Desulfobacteraceae bacterium]|nr:glycine cleavage system protein H [Desulfobacteraceae bacterium]